MEGIKNILETGLRKMDKSSKKYLNYITPQSSHKVLITEYHFLEFTLIQPADWNCRGNWGLNSIIINYLKE